MSDKPLLPDFCEEREADSKPLLLKSFGLDKYPDSYSLYYFSGKVGK